MKGDYSVDYAKLERDMRNYYDYGRGRTPATFTIGVDKEITSWQYYQLRNLDVAPRGDMSNPRILSVAVDNWNNFAEMTQLPFIKRISGGAFDRKYP